MTALDVSADDLTVFLAPPAELTRGRMSFIDADRNGGLDAMVAGASRVRFSNGDLVHDHDFAEAVPDRRLESLAALQHRRAAAARWPRMQDVALPALFLAAIAIVLGSTHWTGSDASVEAVENRLSAPLPALPGSLAELASYPQRFGRYFADRFGLRAEMVALRGRMSLQSLQQSPSPLVIVGRQGWLFYSGNNSIENWRRAIPLSASELDDWAARLAERERWFAAHGIAYLFVVTPDKQSIYPEYMPRFLPAGRGPSRLDQLNERLAGDPVWLDLRPVLRSVKDRGRLYFRTDTHWNDFGAYGGYRTIMQRLGLPALRREQRPLEAAVHDGDLGKLSGVTVTEPDPSFPIRCAIPAPTPFDAAELDRLNPTRTRPAAFFLVATSCAAGRERLLMFQDSFATALRPYLSESFARAVFVWRMPTFAQMKVMVAAEHPTVVIEQRVERFLTEPLDP